MNIPKWAITTICVVVLSVVFIGAYAAASAIKEKANEPIDTSAHAVVEQGCTTERDTSPCPVLRMEVKGEWTRLEGAPELLNMTQLISERGGQKTPDMGVTVSIMSVESVEEFERSATRAPLFAEEDSVSSTPVTIGGAVGYDVSYTAEVFGSKSRVRSLTLYREGKNYEVRFMGEEHKWPSYEQIVSDAIASITIN